MKPFSLFLLLLLLFSFPTLFSQTGHSTNALRFDGVYFTKPRRFDTLSIWTVRCMRFYPDQTVITTTAIYPTHGFDMSKYRKKFTKKSIEPETARGKYTFRNDSLFFSTESYFMGESGQHTIKNHYRAPVTGSDTLTLERRTQYDDTETVHVYFRAFRKRKQELRIKH